MSNLYDAAMLAKQASDGEYPSARRMIADSAATGAAVLGSFGGLAGTAAGALTGARYGVKGSLIEAARMGLKGAAGGAALGAFTMGSEAALSSVDRKSVV